MTTVTEILAQAAEALRKNGHECVTINTFWDCECKHSYIHAADEEFCPICGRSRSGQPDSRLCEVLEQANGLDVLN